MTTWDVLGAVARRWPVAVLGAVATLVVSLQAFMAPGVFLTNTDVYVEPPRGQSPGQLGRFTESSIAMAGVVQRRVNGTSEPRAVSPDVTLVDMGIYHGTMVTLPDSGGQWETSFEEPRLRVSAAASTASAAEALRRRATDKVERALASVQEQSGVPVGSRYVSREIPAAPQVYHLQGRRSVAGAMSLAIGLGLTLLGTVKFDRVMLARRRPGRVRLGTVPAQRPLVGVLAFLALATVGFLATRQADTQDQQPGARDDLPATQLVAPQRLAQQGSLVRSVVLPDGRVAATHWLRSARPMRAITLRAPSSPQFEPGAGAAELELRAQSGALLLSDEQVGSEPRTIELEEPSTLVRLQYTLDGVTQISDSQPGRALVGTVALDAARHTGADDGGVDADGDRSKRVFVRAPAVLSLACLPPGAEPADVRPCGRPRGARAWGATLDGADVEDRVAAQVDLGTVGEDG